MAELAPAEQRPSPREQLTGAGSPAPRQVSSGKPGTAAAAAAAPGRSPSTGGPVSSRAASVTWQQQPGEKDQARFDNIPERDEDPSGDGEGRFMDPAMPLIVPVQRLFEFAAEVWPTPADGPFRATKVVSVKSKYILFNDTGRSGRKCHPWEVILVHAWLKQRTAACSPAGLIIAWLDHPGISWCGFNTEAAMPAGMVLEYKQKGTPDVNHPGYISYGKGRRFAGQLQPHERCVRTPEWCLSPYVQSHLVCFACMVVAGHSCTVLQVSSCMGKELMALILISIVASTEPAITLFYLSAAAPSSCGLLSYHPQLPYVYSLHMLCCSRCAFHWDNINEARLLVIRPAAPGWPWSGAFPLPEREDYFGIRLRNK